MRTNVDLMFRKGYLFHKAYIINAVVHCAALLRNSFLPLEHAGMYPCLALERL